MSEFNLQLLPLSLWQHHFHDPLRVGCWNGGSSLHVHYLKLRKGNVWNSDWPTRQSKLH